MLDSNLIIYPHLDLSLPTIPTRSRLYQLEPIGVGTPYVESLTSYITRLAYSHCIYPKTLFLKELIFASDKHSISLPLKPSNVNIRMCALNGTGVMATDWVHAVESLNFRRDLRFLTLLPWVGVFPSRGLLRHCKAWCPCCYKEWRESGREIHDPLIWALADSRICSHHSCFLDTRCPYCKKQSHWIDWNSEPGYCSRCKQLLGTTLESQPLMEEMLNKEEVAWEMWSTSNVENIIASTPKIEKFPDKDKIRRKISTCIDQVAEGNSAAFSRLLPRPKNTVCLWQSGKFVPPLKGLLQICYVSQITLKDFLLEDETATFSINIGVASSSKIHRSTRGTPQTLDLQIIQDTLENFLFKHELPPLPLRQVAAEIGCDQRIIRNHFPELCYAISNRYASYQRICSGLKIEKTCEEIQQVALKLWADGVFPTQAKVSNLLSKSGCMRNKEARTKLRELQEEFKGSTV